MTFPPSSSRVDSVEGTGLTPRPVATMSPSSSPISNEPWPDIARARWNNFLLFWLVFALIGLYFVYLVLADYGRLVIEAGVASSVLLSAPLGYVFTRRQDTRWRKWVPQRIRIMSDRVVGEFDPVPGVRVFSSEQALKFQGGMRFFDRGGLWAVPRVLCYPPPPGFQLEPRPESTADTLGFAFVLTAANVLMVREAWRVWKKSSPSLPDDLIAPTPSVLPSIASAPEGGPTHWMENRLPDESGSKRLHRLSIGLAIFLEVAIAVLALVLFSPLVGPLGAIEYAVIYLWYFFLIPPVFVLVDWLRAYLTEVPRVGLGPGGVYFKKNGRKVRFVPWGRIYGPSHQIYHGNWVVYVGKKDGSFYLWDFYQVGPEVAKRIAESPGCPRRQMLRSDAEALGLALQRPDVPVRPAAIPIRLPDNDPASRRVADCIWGTDKWDTQSKWSGIYVRAVHLSIPPTRVTEIAREAGPVSPSSGAGDQRRLSRLVRKDERQDAIARAVYLLYLAGDPPSAQLERTLAAASQAGRNTKGSHYGQMAWSVWILAMGAFIALLGRSNDAALGIGLALLVVGVLFLWWDLRQYREWRALRSRPDSSTAVMSAVTHQLLQGTKPGDLIREDGTIRMENLGTEGLPRGVRARVEEAKLSMPR